MRHLRQELLGGDHAVATFSRLQCCRLGLGRRPSVDFGCEVGYNVLVATHYGGGDKADSLWLHGVVTADG